MFLRAWDHPEWAIDYDDLPRNLGVGSRTRLQRLMWIGVLVRLDCGDFGEGVNYRRMRLLADMLAFGRFGHDYVGQGMRS